MKKYLLGILGILAISSTLGVYGEDFEIEDKTVARLVTDHLTIQPGRTFWLGIAIEAQEGWHTYWKNPGEAGLPTTVKLSLPEGFDKGSIQWPAPKKFEQDEAVSYGYEGDDDEEGETVLMAPITAPEGLKEGEEIEIKADVSWLSCKEACLPGEAELSIVMKVSEEKPEPNPYWKERFERSRSSWAQSLDEWKVLPMMHNGELGILLQPEVEGLPELGLGIHFFSEDNKVCPTCDQVLRKVETGYFLELPLEEGEEATYLSGLIHNPKGWKADGSVQNMSVVNAKVSDYADSLPGDFSNMTLLTAVGLAIIGGMILNLMPCVFPVLSLKVLSFVKHGQSDKKHAAKMHGLIFAAGVILSFLALALALILLRATGEQLGWGFQLQSPYFIAFLCFLLTVLALNFAGVFEMGTSFISLGGKLQNSDGYTGTFMSGVLATVLATPCTAPFMGSALGYALTQPILHALYIFGGLGFGMALPYLILSFMPALLKYLPKPGAWMETFKQVMAFPLLATVIWLIWVYGQQTSVNGLALLLFALLTISLGFWIYGKIAAPYSSKKRKALGTFLGVALTATALGIAFWSTQLHEHDHGELTINDPSRHWDNFTPEYFEELREAGTPIFIDFTAAWCLTCQVNKRNVLYKENIIEAFQEKGIVLLQADWTRKDPKITQFLTNIGRSGVPTYALYGEGVDTSVELLPELLTESIVLEAIEAMDSSS